ncbi:MAG: hypothetical protein KA277_04375 [Fusobacteriaceae bacterium]|nr:hypothetical protein [Fusobacteriaceae bacterium]MBP6467241.1 hypothetical protein [Fusobacteriaceae bacterium]MBP9595790.1 hypothetical protein [Fusobacteriaceae bacterium]MBU9917781.1 hypothetical protein [Fusobacteriaceae bacterium]
MKEFDIDVGFERNINFKKTRKEEYLNIDETLAELERSSSIIRLEMNSIELPLFSKDSRRVKDQIKVYHFKTDGSSYLEIEAPAGYSIPGEFEERVFIALTKIMKKHNYSRKFVVSANEILENLNVTNPIYFKKLKTAMELLAKTNYTFMNSLYSNEANSLINKKVHASIMDITIFTRKDKEAKNIEQFDDGRIKEVYQISFSDYFYNNIVQKGYLAFDSEKLLSIDNSIARSVWTMIEKWRGYDLYLRRPIFFIVRRIPLKWDKKNVARTVKTIEKALYELKEFSLIEDFAIIKERKWELAEVEVRFTETHNKVKRDTFYSEKNEFKIDMFVTSTEEKIKEIEIIETNTDSILNMFPDRVLAMKTFENFIKRSIENYGFDYVKYTAEYIISKNPKNYKSYLSKALEENWADEYIARKQLKEQKSIEKPIEIIEEAEILNKYSYKDFESYSEDLQEEITSKVYTGFLNEAQAQDNKIMRSIFEKSKKSLITKYINENEVIEETQFKTEIKEEYVTVTKFLLEVSKLMKENNIDFDLENVATIFKIFGEFEDETLKISYDVETKIGKIQIL